MANGKVTRDQRRARHETEVEESQRGLRESIANTRNLLDASDEMIKRHRREADDAED